MSFPLALGLTVIGTLIPGTGFLAAGRRLLGSVVLSIFVLLLLACGYYALTTDLSSVMHLAVSPDRLRLVSILLPAVGVAWVCVTLGTWRTLQPLKANTLQRLAGSALVTGLAIAILMPLAIGGRYASVQKSVVENVFASSDSRSETRPKGVTREDPWAGQERVNVLLLGGDGGKGRIGIRPDSLQVASIDTRTGNTVLFSLPRNLQKIPFPPDSPLADAYPDGVYAGEGDPLEWMLNSIYENVPAQHPGLLKSDNPGADATKFAVSGALGIRIDYYVLINLQGFAELINALGGITVNINEPVPIGGSEDSGVPPHDWLEPGPNKHLDGYHALWFARGRYGSSDYDRMKRQRCTMKAIIEQANPAKVLTRYEAIAQSSKKIVFTDIPSELLPAFVDLSLKVQKASVRSIAFTNEIIDSSDPDYEQIHSMVQAAIKASEQAAPSKSPRPTNGQPNGKPQASKNGDAPGQTSAPDEADQTSDEGSSSGSEAAASSDEDSTPDPAGESLEEACAYSPKH